MRMLTCVRRVATPSRSDRAPIATARTYSHSPMRCALRQSCRWPRACRRDPPRLRWRRAEASHTPPCAHVDHGSRAEVFRGGGASVPPSACVAYVTSSWRLRRRRRRLRILLRQSLSLLVDTELLLLPH